MNSNLKKALDITTLVGGTAVAGGGILTTFNLIKDKKGILPIVAGVVTTLVGFASIKYSLDSLRAISKKPAPATNSVGKSSFYGDDYEFAGEEFEFAGENYGYELTDDVDDNSVFDPTFSNTDSKIRMDFKNKDFYNPKIGRYMPQGVIKEVTPQSQWDIDAPLDVNSSFDGVFEPSDSVTDNNVFEPTSNFNEIDGVNYGRADFYNPKLGRFAPVGVINEQSPSKEFDINL